MYEIMKDKKQIYLLIGHRISLYNAQNLNNDDDGIEMTKEAIDTKGYGSDCSEGIHNDVLDRFNNDGLIWLLIHFISIS